MFFLYKGFTLSRRVSILFCVSTTTTIHACVALLLLVMPFARPARADGSQSSTELELASLADRARARQSDIETQLAQTSDANERSRLEDLSARNSRVIAAYDARISGSGSSSGSASPAGAPAAPGDSSGGGMLSGITSKFSGLFGGGSSSNPAGPSAQSWGGDSGGGGGFMSQMGTYLKSNWPGLVGGMVGSIAGGMIGKRLTGGSMLGGIAGSIVGGYLGQKGAELIQKMVTGHSAGSAPQQAPAPTQQGPSAYTVAGGQPVYTSPGVQITYPSGYAGGTPVPTTSNLTEAKELMTGRYQSFLAASSNPAMQAQMYQNYMQSKQQYETLLAQGRAQAGQ